jgi:hypothetical protein
MLPITNLLNTKAVVMITLGSDYKVSILLPQIAAREERHLQYSLYWEDRANDDPTLDDTFLVASPSQVTDDDLEIFPQQVAERGWWIYCSDELVQDVIDLAIGQKPNASSAEMLKCLIHYIKNDDFLDLSPES